MAILPQPSDTGITATTPEYNRRERTRLVESQGSDAEKIAALRARKALGRFRSMLPGLNAQARVISGNPEMRIIISQGTPCTDGNVIYMRPPIGLGDDFLHPQRAKCLPVRNSDWTPMCEGCSAEEDVTVTIAHELAHIIHGSFDQVAASEIEGIIDRLAAEAEEAGVAADPERARQVSKYLTSNAERATGYMAAAKLVNPYLGVILNAWEDAFVNRKACESRPGLVPQFKGQTARIFDRGIQQNDGTWSKWTEQHKDMQAIIGVYGRASGYDTSSWVLPEVNEMLDSDEIKALLTRFKTARSVKARYRLAFPTLAVFRKYGFCLRAEDADQQEVPQEDQPVQEAGDKPDKSGRTAPESKPGESSPLAPIEFQDVGGSDDPDDDETDGESGDDKSEDAPKEESSEDASDESGEATEDEAGSDGTGSGSPLDGYHQDNSWDDEDDDEYDTRDQDLDDDDDTRDLDPWGRGDDDDWGDDDDLHDPSSDDESTGSSSERVSDLDGPSEDAGENAPEPESQPEPDYSDPDEIERGLAVFGGHETPNIGFQKRREAKEEELKDAQVEREIEQFEVFDEHATGISGLTVYKGTEVSDNEYGRMMAPRYNEMWPVVMEERVLSPASLKMRVAFHANHKADKRANLKSGKVNAKVLARRIPVNDPRVFHKNTKPGERNYFVLIGMDISGSTHGETCQQIKAAGMAQAELCARLGIKFAVYAHTGDSTKGIEIFEVKGPRDPWTDEARERLLALVAMSGNYDGHTIEWYRKVLDEQKATDKVLMYFTDGRMPATNGPEELVVLQREIATCKKKGYLLVGVGINTDSPKEHGLDTILVDTDSDPVGTVVRGLADRLANHRA